VVMGNQAFREVLVAGARRSAGLTVSAYIGPVRACLSIVLFYVMNERAYEIYSADSVLLGRYFVQDRTEVKYEDISPALIDALIATEDVRFHKHNGIDIRSLGRVLVKTILLQNESAGGGSTITQHLAKNLFPRKEYWFAS